MTPEGKLKIDVVNYLNLSGHRWLRLHSGIVRVRGGWMHSNKEGTADICVFLAHKPVAFVELKAPGALPDKERDKRQAEFAADITALGHFYRICKSVAEVTTFLGEVALTRSKLTP